MGYKRRGLDFPATWPSGTQMWVLSPRFIYYFVVVQSPSLRPHGLQHNRLPSPSLLPRVCSDSWPLSWWHHPTILFSATPFSFCFQSFPEWGSFPMSQLFASGGQSIGVSASASLLSMNIQGWFPLGLTDLTSSQSKGLSRVSSSTTIWKHQFFDAQPYLWLLWCYESSPTPQFESINSMILSLISNSHICIWLLEKP